VTAPQAAEKRFTDVILSEAKNLALRSFMNMRATRTISPTGLVVYSQSCPLRFIMERGLLQVRAERHRT
jgi:hypothetical protein